MVRRQKEPPQQEVRLKFSILLPSRNRPEWIGGAVDSVLAQFYTYWELILLDNSDEPYPQVTRDSRVVQTHRLCSGVADAYAQAVALATGDVLVPLGDDDRLPRNCLQLSEQNFGDALWLNGVTSILNTAGQEIAQRGGNQESVDRTRSGSYWLGGAVHWRRELTEDRSYLSEYEGAADFELYARFIALAPPVLVPEVMYLYTDWPGADSNVRGHEQQTQSARIQAQLKENEWAG